MHDDKTPSGRFQMSVKWGTDLNGLSGDGIISYGHPDRNVSLEFMEGLNNKIRLIQCNVYGI